jgi:hypothetical protein
MSSSNGNMGSASRKPDLNELLEDMESNQPTKRQYQASESATPTTQLGNSDRKDTLPGSDIKMELTTSTTTTQPQTFDIETEFTANTPTSQPESFDFEMKFTANTATTQSETYDREESLFRR